MTSVFAVDWMKPFPTFKTWVSYGNIYSTPELDWNAFVINAGGASYDVYAEHAIPDYGPLFAIMLKNGVWVPAGQINSSPNTIWASLAINVADPNSTPYIAYSPEPDNIFFSAPVIVDHFDGKKWNPVGANSLPAGVSGDAFAVNAQGMPYLFYETADLSHLALMDFNGTRWVQAGPNISIVGGTTSSNFFLGFDANGTPYVSYVNNGCPSGTPAVVMKLVGNTWQQLGSGLPLVNNMGQALSITVTPNGIPYVAYSGSNQGLPHVIKLDTKSNQWVPVGQFPNEFYTISDISIAISTSGTPYVVMNGILTNFHTSTAVMRLNNQNNQWDFAANKNFFDDAKTEALSPLSLLFDVNNNPYISYISVNRSGEYPGVKTLSN